MLKPFSMTISDQIHDLGEDFRLTHRDIAGTADFSADTVQAVEFGHGTIRSMIAVLAVLAARISWSSHRCRNDLGQCLADERTKRLNLQTRIAAMMGFHH